jgi:hypothetical protein
VTLISESDSPYDPEIVVIYLGETKLGNIPKAKMCCVSNLLYFGHGDILDTKISSRNLEEHTKSQFLVIIKLKDISVILYTKYRKILRNHKNCY